MPQMQRQVLFPDTVSERAQRHVRDAIAARAAGHEAVRICCLAVLSSREVWSILLILYMQVLIFCVQRNDCQSFAPCQVKDPQYASLVQQAAAAGVQLIALRFELAVDTAGKGTIRYQGSLPITL